MAWKAQISVTLSPSILTLRHTSGLARDLSNGTYCISFLLLAMS